MPRSLDPEKYPPDYFLLLDRAQDGPVIINPVPNDASPHPDASGLRGHFQAFLRACETDPVLRTRAKGTQATSHPGDPLAADERKRYPHMIVQRRTNSVYARAIAAALGTSPDAEAARAAHEFAQRLAGKGPQ